MPHKAREVTGVSAECERKAFAVSTNGLLEWKCVSLLVPFFSDTLWDTYTSSVRHELPKTHVVLHVWGVEIIAPMISLLE